MDRAGMLCKMFMARLAYEPTPCQENMLAEASEFLTSDDADIMIVNGYAGTGKTTAISAIINTMLELKMPCVLLAPTGRAAKVLSHHSGRKASTIHKHIYRQKSVGDAGYGSFSLAPNKSNDTLFIIDEVSLIGSEAAERQGFAEFGSGNLLEDLVSFVRSGSGNRMIMLGDCAQLPPVGLETSPALDASYMDNFGGVRYIELTTVVRQKQESGILANATMLRETISYTEPYETIPDLMLDVDGYADIERISGGDLIETITDAYSRYGEEETMILCRSNKRAIRYNLGIRSTVQYREEQLLRGDRLMIVKNCYQFLEDVPEMDYIANGDMAELVRLGRQVERYGLHFADATLSFPDYDGREITAKVCLDTLCSESASLTYEQQNALYEGVNADYSHITSKKKRWEAVREDPFFNALQLKYAAAITCHKSQGGQWRCVFIDCPFWQDEQTVDDLKWLYTALTRAVDKVYLVNFNDRFFM